MYYFFLKYPAIKCFGVVTQKEQEATAAVIVNEGMGGEGQGGCA